MSKQYWGYLRSDDSVVLNNYTKDSDRDIVKANQDATIQKVFYKFEAESESDAYDQIEAKLSV